MWHWTPMRPTTLCPAGSIPPGRFRPDDGQQRLRLLRPLLQDLPARTGLTGPGWHQQLQHVHGDRRARRHSRAPGAAQQPGSQRLRQRRRLVPADQPGSGQRPIWRPRLHPGLGSDFAARVSWIRTANSSKTFTGNPTVSFDVGQRRLSTWRRTHGSLVPAGWTVPGPPPGSPFR